MRFCLAILLVPISLSAATYYVDFDSGNDANAGTSTGAAFKTIPGTRTTDGSAFLNSAWGSFSTSARVPDNTTFKIKSGTTHNAANGGYVWMSSGSTHLYNNGYTNLVFQKDSTWGSGDATLDASGMTIGIAVLLVQIDGVTVQGLKIQNSSLEGLQAKEHQGSGLALTNLNFLDLSFANNGTSFASDAAGAGSGNLNVRHAFGVSISNVVVNGNQQFINGILLGDSSKTVQACTVLSCVTTNLKGSIVGNDSGIGIKALNSQVVVSGCSSAWNLKGFDGGEQNGGGADISYKVINCTFTNNYWGCNFNSVAAPYAGVVNFYLLNSLIVSNQFTGANIYAGPFSVYVVHNVFDLNGPGSAPTYGGGHLGITPNASADTNQIRAYVFNNIFRRAQEAPVYTESWFSPTNNYTLNADYNSYAQNASELFAMWSYSYGPQVSNFSYGADGPGHASGNWYSWYGADTTPPIVGTGHFHCDANSKGTGCSDTGLPSLNSNYQLLTPFPGSNLSAQPWYIAEMGLDRNGNPRTHWDMGAYESLRYARVKTAHAGGIKGK